MISEQMTDYKYNMPDDEYKMLKISFFRAKQYYFQCYNKHIRFYLKLYYILNNKDILMDSKKNIIYYDQEQKKFFLNVNDPDNIVKNKEIFLICQIEIEHNINDINDINEIDIDDYGYHLRFNSDINNIYYKKIQKYSKFFKNITYLKYYHDVFYYLMYLIKEEKIIININDNIQEMYIYKDD